VRAAEEGGNEKVYGEGKRGWQGLQKSGKRGWNVRVGIGERLRGRKRDCGCVRGVGYGREWGREGYGRCVREFFFVFVLF
jgi:hypothetical protein